MALRVSSSVVFDAVTVKSSESGDQALSFLLDAVRHCKVVGWVGIQTLAKKVQLEEGDGLMNLETKSELTTFLATVRQG
jgi:hypothetical protein